MRKLIGLYGKKGSGKSLVADYISKKFNYKRINFKDSLIEEIKENFPDLLSELIEVYKDDYKCWTINDLFEIKPPLVRKLMQNYGTELRRKENENYWVKKWEDKFIADGNCVIVDDVRFINEYETIIKYGGILFEIKRDGYNGDKHSSETESDPFIAHFYISNNGPKEDLYSIIDSIFEKY